MADSDKKHTTKEAILATARLRWKLAHEADSDQRLQEREDLSFQVPENQWTDEAKKERKGRPMLSVSKLDQPVQLVLNQERAAKLGVNVHPLSEEANDDTAQAIQGLYRHIERDSRAGIARSWAFQRAVLAGRGYWRVNAVYEEDSENPFDQKLVIEQIYYQHSVAFDPASTQPNGSDANYVFVESWVDEDTYKREWPDAKFPANALELEAMDRDAPGWTEIQGEGRAYRVVEYWYKEHETETIVMLADGSVVREDEVPEGAQLMLDPAGKPLRRDRDVIRVKFCKISGSDVLEQVNWDGKYIPIIRLMGRELQPFDGKRRSIGLINHAKDAQKFFNYSVSTYVERMSSEPKAPFVGYEGQFEGYEDEWDAINTKNIARLQVKPIIAANGQVLPLPQRMQIDLTGTSLAGQAMQIADGLIQSTTTVYDAGLGRLTEDTRKSSGRALLALQQQADASTGDFIQNLADAMECEALITLDLLPAKYDRPGRVTRILRGDDDKAESVMLNAPFAIVDGRPVPITAGDAANAKEYNLKRGRYGVSVAIGKSFQTRLEHGAEFMANILERMPEYLPLLGDLLFRYRDDPGAKEIADRLAKVREQKFHGLGEGEDGQIPPEQLQAQNQALQQESQMLKAQLQAAAQALETDKAKQEATLLKAQLDQRVTLQKAEMDNMTKVELARINQDTAAKEDALKVLLEEMGQRFDALQASLDRAHEERIHREEMAHDVAMAAAGARTVTHTHEGGQETGQEQTDESSVPQADGAEE